VNTFLRSKCVINISLMNSFYASIFRNCSISGQWLSHPESNLPRRTKIQICINDVFMKQTTLKHYVLRILIIFCSVHCSEYRSLPIFNYYLLMCLTQGKRLQVHYSKIDFCKINENLCLGSKQYVQ
jgi:hypothetical protein